MFVTLKSWYKLPQTLNRLLTLLEERLPPSKVKISVGESPSPSDFLPMITDEIMQEYEEELENQIQANPLADTDSIRSEAWRIVSGRQR
jgi:hypothetical protein